MKYFSLPSFLLLYITALPYLRLSQVCNSEAHAAEGQAIEQVTVELATLIWLIN